MQHLKNFRLREKVILKWLPTEWLNEYDIMEKEKYRNRNQVSGCGGWR